MHGKIHLESVLGSGTKATFSVPFNRPQFANPALVSLASIPVRLQSEFSMSASPSDEINASPQSPLDPGARAHPGMSRSGSLGSQPSVADLDRKTIHVLVVEDKSVVG